MPYFGHIGLGYLLGKTKVGKKAMDWITGEDVRKAQIEANEREYRNAIEMYERQRADALADREFENEYNSPQSIMERYRLAGLNPNLLYQNSYTAGASTRSSSATGAPKVRTEYGAPRYLETLSAISSTVGMGSNIATQATQRASNMANASLANANTVKSLADAARTTQQKEQADKLFDTTFKNAQLSNEKIQTDIANIKQGWEFKERQLDQEDKKILQNARKLDQADIKLDIERQNLKIKEAKNEADIRKINEDILKSIVYRQTNNDVRQLMSAQIASAEAKASIDSITAQYTSRILDAQLSKNTAEVAKLYSAMTNDIIKSIPVLSWLTN